MTEQRRVIARVLSDATDHPDAEELYRRASVVDPHISIATVYRTVKLFEDAGILERHDFRDGRSRYEEIPESHHDHLIDVQSGRVVEASAQAAEHGGVTAPLKALFARLPPESLTAAGAKLGVSAPAMAAGYTAFFIYTALIGVVAIVLSFMVAARQKSAESEASA